jgi:hypothetical protein
LAKLQARLTHLAALGVVLVMAGAVVFHLTRNEFTNIFMNLILMGLTGFVAYGRWKLSLLKDKGAA